MKEHDQETNPTQEFEIKMTRENWKKKKSLFNMVFVHKQLKDCSMSCIYSHYVGNLILKLHCF